MHRRPIGLALALLAGAGFLAQPPAQVMAKPAWDQGVTRRTTRRVDTRHGAWLPGKKGRPEKHSGKACRHGKPARNRRRAARMKGL